ncbi:flagellin lysine-N-methylase [Lysinibacillus contaminans]|uniref:flagellin lysine-N-methylase n=1 Tax=Lysinibacillus contaminans TaxID=1293441 RepID=UPI0006AF7FC3|nr:flagellin lysine-N-methylase [Lysinibacillus contaminans]
MPEAARVVLLREEGLGFIETEEPKNTRGLISNVLNLEKHSHFWNLRIFTIQLMQNRQHSIEIRLIILGLFIQKIEQLNLRELELELPVIMQDYLSRLDNQEFIESLKNIEGNLKFQINLARDLIRYRISDGITSKKYGVILNQLVEGLELDEDKEEFEIEKTILKYRDSFESFYEPFIKKQQYMLENYIFNYVFKNLFPNDYNSLFESYMMLIIHFNLIKLHLIGMAAKQKHLNEEMVIECVQQ